LQEIILKNSVENYKINNKVSVFFFLCIFFSRKADTLSSVTALI